MPTTILTEDRDRLDRICRRFYGTWTGGLVEQILAINPHLADQGEILPIGVVIVLPDPPVTKKVVQTVKLWG